MDSRPGGCRHGIVLRSRHLPRERHRYRRAEDPGRREQSRAAAGRRHRTGLDLHRFPAQLYVVADVPQRLQLPGRLHPERRQRSRHGVGQQRLRVVLGSVRVFGPQRQLRRAPLHLELLLQAQQAGQRHPLHDSRGYGERNAEVLPRPGARSARFRPLHAGPALPVHL